MVLRVISGKRARGTGASSSEPSASFSASPEGLRTRRSHASSMQEPEDRTPPEMRELVRGPLSSAWDGGLLCYLCRLVLVLA